MKWKFVGLAIVITVIMLFIARTNSRGRSEHVKRTIGDITFEMNTVPKIVEHEKDTVRVTVTGIGKNDKVLFRNIMRDPSGHDTVVTSQLLQSWGTDTYRAEVVAGSKGLRRLYAIDVVDSANQHRARFLGEKGEPFYIRYIGRVPGSVLALHVIFIFATVFFVAMGALYAWQLFKGAEVLRQIAFHFFWAVVCCWLGGYPFGFAMNYYAFGGLWEGVPFGTDATDNKTQLILVYLIMVAVVAAGHYGKGMLGRAVFSQRTLAVIAIGAVPVMAFIYLIPHSIQFSAGFTYAFCYAFTGIVVAIYLIGFLTSKPVTVAISTDPGNAKPARRK